ncbi:MAG: DUF502 domain-containing protein [Elusimicrobiota bacterium]|jgi:uncharacterized membrane protein|nr:DUF502 domain-containing protein [Elusimicrobiota bacterium]
MENSDNQNIGKRLTFFKKLYKVSKSHLFAGIVVIVPIWITYFVFSFLFNLVISFAFGIVSKFVPDGYFVEIGVRIASFFVSVVIVVLIGFVSGVMFGKKILGYIENIIDKLPIFGTVYSAAKQFVNFVFENRDGKNFRKVVFVPYPNDKCYSIAFLTGEQYVDQVGKRFCVFMPTIPNPATGFLLLFKNEDIIYTNYTVEQAFQSIMSAGVVGMKDLDSVKLNIKE